MIKRASIFLNRFVLPCIFLCVMLLVLMHGIVDPLLCFDPWAYHLPFAARIWDIGQTVQYTSSSPRFEGFGLAANWFQGLFWAVFGSVNFVALTSFIPFCIMLFLAWRWMNVSVEFLAFSVLTVPLIAIHITSAYIDFFIAALLAIFVISAYRVLRLGSSQHYQKKELYRALAVFILSGALASNSKFPQFIVVAVLSAYLVCCCWQRKGHSFRLIFLACTLAVLLASTTLVKNAILFHNPFYPFRVEILGFPPFPGYEKDDTLVHSPPPLWYRPFYFLSSATEIDYLVNPLTKGFVYAEASQLSAGRPGTEGKRTGGFFGPFIWLQLSLLAVCVWKMSCNRNMRDDFRDAFNLFLAVTFILMWIPNYHELRYSMVWPLVLCVVNAMYVKQFLPSVWPRFSSLAPWLALLGLIGVQAFIPLQRTLWPTKVISYYPEAVKSRLDPVILDAFRKHELPCVFDIKQPYDYDHFKSCGVSIYAYSPAFTREAYPFHFRISGDNCQPPQ